MRRHDNIREAAFRVLSSFSEGEPEQAERIIVQEAVQEPGRGLAIAVEALVMSGHSFALGAFLQTLGASPPVCDCGRPMETHAYCSHCENDE